MKNISKKKGSACDCLAVSNLSHIPSVFDQLIPSLFQQAVAKEHEKKRWSASSWVAEVHMTQKALGCTLKCLLTSMLFVLSLSTSMSQAKNLILGVHLDFHRSL